ncbi:hypothetical protein D3C81_597630 [compost metagenome]
MTLLEWCLFSFLKLLFDIYAKSSEGEWLLFLKGADTSRWEMLKMNEPGLEKAMEAYVALSSDRRRIIPLKKKGLICS